MIDTKPMSAITGMVTKPKRSSSIAEHGASSEHAPDGSPGRRCRATWYAETTAPMPASGIA